MLCRLFSAASSTFGAFVIGAVGSVIGTVVAWLLLGSRLGTDGWKVSLEQSFLCQLQLEFVLSAYLAARQMHKAAHAFQHACCARTCVLYIVLISCHLLLPSPAEC